MFEHLLSDKFWEEVVSALKNGKEYKYSDDFSDICITPNGINIKYQSVKKPVKDSEVNKFINFMNNLDNDLFIEVCESFGSDTLAELEKNLTTDKYQLTIDMVTERVKEIADRHICEIESIYDSKIQIIKEIIATAEDDLKRINNELTEAKKKYII